MCRSRARKTWQLIRRALGWHTALHRLLRSASHCLPLPYSGSHTTNIRRPAQNARYVQGCAGCQQGWVTSPTPPLPPLQPLRQGQHSLITRHINVVWPMGLSARQCSRFAPSQTRCQGAGAHGIPGRAAVSMRGQVGAADRHQTAGLRCNPHISLWPSSRCHERGGAHASCQHSSCRLNAGLNAGHAAAPPPPAPNQRTSVASPPALLQMDMPPG